MRKINSKGYSIIELMVVIGIIAVLMGMAGLATYFSTRDNLLLEQAAQDLTSEIRLVQSKILGIQNINGKTPKAAVIKISSKPGEDVEIAYLSGHCIESPERDKTFKIEPRATIKNIAPSDDDDELYLVYTTPAGRFYSFASSDDIESIDFTDAINNGCKPEGYDIYTDPDNNFLEITLTNGNKDYLISIDTSNGSTTAGAI